MTAPVRDAQRSKVYAAERTLRWLYDHPAAGHEIGGVTLQLEPEARFASLDSIAAYLDQVVSHPSVIAAVGHRGPIGVRERKGDRQAHYEAGSSTIAVNTGGTRWALRELVVLHEIAHHYTAQAQTGHGPEFAAAMVALTESVIGPQAALALRLLYAQNGVAHIA